MKKEEMKALGFKRFTVIFERRICTNVVEVFAENENDAREICKKAAWRIPPHDFDFDDTRTPICLEESNEELFGDRSAQYAVDNINEDFYKSLPQQGAQGV